MAILLNGRKSEKDAVVALQKAMSGGNEDEILQAWNGFHESIVQTIENRSGLGTYVNQKNNSPFMKIKDFEHRDLFRQKFDDANSQNNMTIGDFGKGVLLNQWGDFKQQAPQKVDGSILVPTSILSDIIYEASQHSVLLGNCPVLPMDEGTVLIGKVKDGIELDFKEKYAEGKQADLGLEGITLEAKTLYAYVIIAEEDLQDLKNLDSILRKAFSMAVAETLDNNFLYTNLNSSSKPGVYPSGILDNPGIKQISVQSADYDMIAKAKLELAKANGKANTVGYNPIESFKIQTMKDSTGQYINPPSFYNELSKIESNGLKPNDVIVFDSNQILVGIRKQMDIKMLPDLENGTVIMRCMLRADVLPVREDHICKITIEEDEEESKRSKTK